jgi:putative sterol carrier protein
MQNKANSAALSQLTKQETMVGAFEKNFVKNADLVLKFSSKVDRAGAPLLDKWIQSGKRAATGDPELKALDVAIKAVSNEYAKIVSGSMGNTAVAVSEIKRMESLLNSAMTKQDVLSVINVMKTETENRMAGFKEQKAELTNSMRGGVSAPPVGGVLKPEVKILLDKYK